MLQRLVLTILPLAVSFTFADQPGDMYRRIKKPTWTPPPIAFPIIWTALYLLMGYASSRVAASTGLWSLPLLAYAVQLVLNVSWTPVFFGKGEFARALAILRALVVAVVVTAALFWRVDSVAGVLLLPYIAWLGVAHELNRSIVALNRRR